MNVWTDTVWFDVAQMVKCFCEKEHTVMLIFPANIFTESPVPYHMVGEEMAPFESAWL